MKGCAQDFGSKRAFVMSSSKSCATGNTILMPAFVNNPTDCNMKSPTFPRQERKAHAHRMQEEFNRCGLLLMGCPGGKGGSHLLGNNKSSHQEAKLCHFLLVFPLIPLMIFSGSSAEEGNEPRHEMRVMGCSLSPDFWSNSHPQWGRHYPETPEQPC